MIKTVDQINKNQANVIIVKLCGIIIVAFLSEDPCKFI